MAMGGPAGGITVNFNVAPLSLAIVERNDGLLKVGAGQYVPTSRMMYDDDLTGLCV